MTAPLAMCRIIANVGLRPFTSIREFTRNSRLQNKHKGFGDEIKWFNLEDGLATSNHSNKPLMLLIHKSWCGACKALKPEFAGSREIKELSKYFVMVNVEDDEEPKDKKFTPDGGYIPRILFLAPGGEVQGEFFNEGGNPSYKYFYSDADSIVVSMKKVADKFKVAGKADDEL